MFSSKYIEPAVRLLGLNGVINIGFFILIASNFALWLFVLIIVNSSDFATCVFCTRLASGIGSGLINSACLISRANQKNTTSHDDTNADSYRSQQDNHRTGIPRSEKDRSISETANSYFRQHMFGEALGDIGGPLLIVCFYGIVGATGIFCILAIVSFCVWMSCAVVMALEAEKEPEIQSPIN